jgi:MFS family permease
MRFIRFLVESIKVLAESLWYEAFTFTLVLTLGFVSPDIWFVPTLFGAILLFGVWFALLVFANVRLFPIYVSLGLKPWSYRASLLRYIIECIAGCLAAALGIVAHAIIADVFGIVSLVSGNYPNAALIASALAVGAIIGVPGYRFWRMTRRFHLLRVTEKMLIRLREYYTEHLNHPLMEPGSSFPVEVTFEPLEVVEASLPTTDQPTLPSQPAPPRAIMFPALSASLPQPSSERPLTPAEITHEQICQYFDESHRQLLLLSGSGGGKSAQLYLLANTLLAEALTELQHMFESAANGRRRKKLRDMPRLPVIMDLSVLDLNFGVTPHANDPVHDWQRVALVKIYGVRRRTARRWVAHGRITSLCDSLDVLEDRNAPLISINKYLRHQPSAPIAVCCSEETYQGYLVKMSHIYENFINFQSDSQPGSPLLLSSVTLKPLAPETVDRVLLNARNTDAIRNARQRDMAFAEALQSPMVLRLALDTSPREAVAAPLDATGSAVGWPVEIGRRYISGAPNAAPGSQAHKTLTWLGNQLRDHQKLVFHLEEMQRDWLPSPASKDSFDVQIDRLRVFFITVTTLLFGIVFPPAVLWAIIHNNGAAIKQVLGSEPGLPIAFLIPLYVFFGLLGGFGLASSIGHRISDVEKIELLKHIHPIADAHRRKIIPVALVGIFILLTAVFIGGPAVVPSGAVLLGAGASLVIGLVIAWCGRLATERRHFPPPNRGLSNAIKSSLVIMFIMALLGGCVTFAGALLLILVVNLDVGHTLPVFLVGAVVVALVVAIIGLGTAFINGGSSVLRHRMLLRALQQSQFVPRKLVPFLNQLRASGLLRREGDGYSFPVRSAILRNAFAAEYVKHYAEGQKNLKPPKKWHTHLRDRVKRGSQVFAPSHIAKSLQRKPRSQHPQPSQQQHGGASVRR